MRVKNLKQWLEAHAARWLEWEVYLALRLNHAAAIVVLLNVPFSLLPCCTFLLLVTDYNGTG